MTNALIDALLSGKDPARILAHLEDGRCYRYQDAWGVSAQFANILTERGVQPGDRVALQVPKSMEALMLVLGIIRAGAVVLPLNTAYTPAEISYFLENARPRLFVCDPAKEAGYHELTAKLGIQLETLGVWRSHDISAGTLADAGLQASKEFATVPRTPGDLAAILYTSGTTGRSKGAMLSHDNLRSNAQTLADYWRFTQDDTLLHALPIFHTHGLFVASNVTMLAGGSMIFLERFDNDQVIENLPKATAMMGVPTFYTRLLDDPRLTEELVDHIRVFISGSAPLLAETHIAFEQRTGKRILERYGMTETNMNTSNPYDGERRAGTVGFPLPGIEVKITDPETGQTLSINQTGSIEVRGPNVFSGYWEMPEKTAEELRPDGFFITGDLGKIDDDGYIHIVGRAKDLIISGGYNIYPKEIELILDELDGVAESAIIGIPHPDFGEGVVGILVAKPGAALDPSALQRSIKDKIARFKQPKHLLVVDALPRNTMGKVQKNQLRDQFAGLFADPFD